VVEGRSISRACAAFSMVPVADTVAAVSRPLASGPMTAVSACGEWQDEEVPLLRIVVSLSGEEDGRRVTLLPSTREFRKTNLEALVGRLYAAVARIKNAIVGDKV
jgi:hypothetical protein